MKRIKDAARRILNVLRLVHQLDRAAIPVMIGRAIVSAANPLVTILVSSMVIGGLETQSKPKSIVATALFGIGLFFILSLLLGWLEKVNSIRRMRCMLRYNGMVGQTTMSMDYPILESPSTQELRERMRLDGTWNAGFFSLFTQFESLVQSLFSMIFALTVVFPLLQNSPLFGSGSIIYYLLFVILLTAVLIYLNSFQLQRRFHHHISSVPKEMKTANFFVFDNGLNYRMGKDVRIYKAQGLMDEFMQDLMHGLRKFAAKTSLLRGMMEGARGLSGGIIQGGAYLFVGLRALSGSIALGEVVRYAGAIYQFCNALSRFTELVGSLHETAKRQESTFQYFNTPHILHKGILPVKKYSDFDYDLEFLNVSFKYPGADTWALRNLSLKLTTGRRLAVVGMNGSGKTTMIKLLCRLYDPTEGKITLNGIDIKNYDYQEYMGIFSVVFQDFQLFSFSLGQNVAADMVYDDEKVATCLKLVGFGDRLAAMLRGLNTPLFNDFEEHGVEISGGEAQKIALARALYRNAPFIILDEPTAALDPIAESEIYTKFNDITENKTTIFISHRLSSCRFCHNIVVFHKGELVQSGNHEELIADKNGKYYELWNAQAQYYNDG